MKIKKLIIWVALAVIAYYGLEIGRVQTSGDVVAYKRFSQALLHGRMGRAELTSNSDLSKQLSSSQEARVALHRGVKIVFTYYVVHARRLSADGRTAYITGEQVSRVNAPGVSTLWGQREIRVPQTVELEYRQNLWKVTKFSDPAMRSG